MKTVLSFVFLFIFSSALLAQNSIPRGTYNIAGSVSFSSVSVEHSTNNQNTFALSPQVGYFFANNISLSLLLQYTHNSVGDNSSNQWGLGPGVRYYFELENVHPFLGASFLYGKTTNSSDDTFTNTVFLISGGFDYFLNESVAIEAGLSYSFENIKLPDSYSYFISDLDVSSNTIKVGVGINVFIR